MLVLILFLFQMVPGQGNGLIKDNKVTISVRSVPLKDVLAEIERQSHLHFFYSTSQIPVRQKVNLDLSGTLEEVLNRLFEQTNVLWQLDGKQILLKKGDTEIKKRLTYSDQARDEIFAGSGMVPPAVTGLTNRRIAEINVSGTVKDESGMGLPGVNVVLKGTRQGTVTDTEGRFTIAVPGNQSVLVFSFVGYVSQEVAVGNESRIEVTLKVDEKALEEVVVIGYGTVKQTDLTGSVASVSAKNFRDQPITRLDQAINGRVPGVMVVTNSGAPVQNVQVRIRGANSINGGNDPLYIVDGVPNSTLFNNLDPSDVQSIEVLKDASATAIYGSRGANGVVLVTTKRGAEGKSRIQFETQQSFSSLSKKMDMLGAEDYANFYNEYVGTDFYKPSDRWRQHGGIDWQDLIFRTAHTQNYTLSASGGSSKLKYLVSGSALDVQGILIRSQTQRYNIRSNINVNATDWLNINLDMNAIRRRTSQNGPRGGIGGVITDALTTSPSMDLKDENGNWIKDQVSSIVDNPYGRLMQDRDEGFTNYFNGNLQLTVDLPVNGLSLNLQGAANYRTYKGYWMNSKANNLRTASNRANNNTDETFDWYSLSQLNYSRQWGDHQLTATGVVEMIQETGTSMYTEVIDLRTESVGFWNLPMGNITGFGNSFSRSSLMSYFGRAMYQLKDRYYLTATFRRDGSSRFQGNNKWGSFPSLAVGWKLSEESFLKDVQAINLLKVRGSWGVTGNQAIGPYSTLGLLTLAQYGWGTETYRPGYRVDSPATSGLTWEKTYQWDIGLDLALFHNKVSVNIDYYNKRTKDLLLQKNIPLYDGGGAAWVNQGEVLNKGLDFALSVVPVESKHLYWESMLSLSFQKNKVTNLGGEKKLHPGGRINQASINTSVLQVGEPMGSIYGYFWEGLWRTDETEEAAKWGQKPGDNKFRDRNGNYRLDYEDSGIIGKAFPDVILGFNNKLTWRKLDLNVFFQGAFGADRLNLGRYLMTEAISDARFITSREGYYDRWTPEHQDTKVPNPFSNTINTRVETAQYLEKANFVRLKNVSLGYTFPKTPIGELKLSLSAQNLFTFTSYTGYDPEGSIQTGGSSDVGAGVDGISYPQPRTFTAGLRLSF